MIGEERQREHRDREEHDDHGNEELNKVDRLAALCPFLIMVGERANAEILEEDDEDGQQEMEESGLDGGNGVFSSQEPIDL